MVQSVGGVCCSTVGQQQVVLDTLRSNGDPTGSDLAGCLGAGNACEAAYLIQQSHSWLNLGNTWVTMRDSVFNFNKTPDSVIIDAWQSAANGPQYYFERTNLWSPNLRYTPSTNDDATYGGRAINRYKGFGSFDRNVFAGEPFSTSTDLLTPMWGYRPAPWSMPRLSPNQFAFVSGALAWPYPLIHGDVLYQVLDYASVGMKLVRSNHHFLSYGQNIASSWTYKGASNFISMPDTTRMVDGLYIGLTLSGTASWFVVTGIYPSLGGITVTSVGNGVNVPINPGDKLTVYSGATILQEPYAFTSVTLQ